MGYTTKEHMVPLHTDMRFDDLRVFRHKGASFDIRRGGLWHSKSHKLNRHAFHVFIGFNVNGRIALHKRVFGMRKQIGIKRDI